MSKIDFELIWRLLIKPSIFADSLCFNSEYHIKWCTGCFIIWTLISTGSKAKIQLKVCRGGSLELNCKYWNSGDNNDVTLCHPGGRLKSTQKNQWEHKDRFSLFRDTRRKELKVVIRQLEQRDDGTYSCPCDSDDSSSNERDDMEVKIICGKTCCFMLLFLMPFFPDYDMCEIQLQVTGEQDTTFWSTYATFDLCWVRDHQAKLHLKNTLLCDWPSVSIQKRIQVGTVQRKVNTWYLLPVFLTTVELTVIWKVFENMKVIDSFFRKVEVLNLVWWLVAVCLIVICVCSNYSLFFIISDISANWMLQSLQQHLSQLLSGQLLHLLFL